MKHAKYKFACSFDGDATLPSYKGSTIRGVFGHALKKVVCALKKTDCTQCLLADRCLYTTVFEISARAPAEKGRKRIAQPPHPYVIEPPADLKTSYKKGDPLDFSLFLFGAACDHLPYFIYAFDSIRRIGKRINGKAATFSLDAVYADGTQIYSKASGKIDKSAKITELTLQSFDESAPAEPHDIELELVTPLRLKYKNGLTAELPFDVLIRAALRRISSLYNYHGGGEPRLDYRGLVARARNVSVKETHIGWYDWRRYSNRQEQAMMMGGMVGKIIYENVPREYVPILKFCEQVHLGKATTFGLGKIKVTQK